MIRFRNILLKITKSLKVKKITISKKKQQELSFNDTYYDCHCVSNSKCLDKPYCISTN